MNEATGLATTSIASAWALIGNVLAFVIVVIALVAFAMREGRSAMVALVVSLYMGYALYSVFPFGDMLVGITGSQPITNIIVYVVLTFISYLLVRRIGGGGSSTIQMFPLVVLCLLTAGFVMALGYSVLDVDKLYNLPQTLDLLFAPKEYFFWWFIAPIVGTFVLAR